MTLFDQGQVGRKKKEEEEEKKNVTYVLDVSRVWVVRERKERKRSPWNSEPLFRLEAYLPLVAEYTC